MKLKKAKKKGKKNAARTNEQEVVDTEESGEPKRGRPAMINYDKFVSAWRGAGSVTEVSDALGIKRNSASAIAARLRKAGVKLDSFPRRGSQTIDVKRLNKIAAGEVD